VAVHLDATRAPLPSTGEVVLLVGTRKGAFFLRSDRTRTDWQLHGPHFLGNIVHHAVLDPRDGRTILVAARTGHLGPTIFRSTDLGETWQEAATPPRFPKAAEGETGRKMQHVFWLAPGHVSEPGVWYAGVAPQGLFRSEDAGVTWEGVAGFNQNANLVNVDMQDVPPGAATFSGIIVDPRDARHMYIGLSGIGVFESTDQGASWLPLNKGCQADWPLEDPDYGYDTHCLRLHPLSPDRLYQQNHCGIYRLDRAEGQWVRIGEAMPRETGDIGFPIVLHPRDPDTAWVFPMDGTSVWPRTNVAGKPAAYVTRNAGETWTRQDNGLPRQQAWWNVKRQGMSVDAHDPIGVYFGTTNGEVWGSCDEGQTWTCLVRDLPEVFSVEAAELA
jgi:photosystem II stability/assembly factor-like uncharacterized protein